MSLMKLSLLTINSFTIRIHRDLTMALQLLPKIIELKLKKRLCKTWKKDFLELKETVNL